MMTSIVHLILGENQSKCENNLGYYIKLDRNTDTMFSISFRKYHDEEKEKQLVFFDHQNVNSLCSRHHYVNSSC